MTREYRRFVTVVIVLGTAVFLLISIPLFINDDGPRAAAYAVLVCIVAAAAVWTVMALRQAARADSQRYRTSNADLKSLREAFKRRELWYTGAAAATSIVALLIFVRLLPWELWIAVIAVALGGVLSTALWIDRSRTEQRGRELLGDDEISTDAP